MSFILRRLKWPLLAVALAALGSPGLAGAYHLPGFGHDNTLAAGLGTGALCNVADGCLLVDNGNTGGTGIVGRHTAASGSGPGVRGETNSATAFAAGVRGLSTSGASTIAVWGSGEGRGY